MKFFFRFRFGFRYYFVPLHSVAGNTPQRGAGTILLEEKSIRYYFAHSQERRKLYLV